MGDHKFRFVVVGHKKGDYYINQKHTIEAILNYLAIKRLFFHKAELVRENNRDVDDNDGIDNIPDLVKLTIGVN